DALHRNSVACNLSPLDVPAGQAGAQIPTKVASIAMRVGQSEMSFWRTNTDFLMGVLKARSHISDKARVRAGYIRLCISFLGCTGASSASCYLNERKSNVFCNRAGCSL